ncbi:hypothetical protein TIFTF001_016175 [Ficus carica]|uniref:Bifunctional inhibitor/plant lipid transfer protein/seed storage helical domain-containing protein n=1 Tax=Ficus carica TaxID=3494 RepID=A0AA88A2M7_FICCA|nr:hypothetical protein TIFTF001_016175 [Ficus carica]
MAKIATTIWLLVFGLWTSTLFDAQAQPAAAPSLGPSTSISSPGSGPVASGPEVAPAPGTDCLTVLLGMADCLSYVQQGSNETKPDKACCPELKSIVDTQPQCLCELLGNGDSYGYQIDFNRATKLPSVCKVDAPPVSTCARMSQIFFVL